MPIEEILEALEVLLGFPALPPETREMLLSLREHLNGLPDDAGPSEVQQALGAFWVEKGMGLLDLRTTGTQPTPEDVAAKLMKDAREHAARGRLPGGPALGGRIAKPEPLDPEFSRKLQEAIDEAVETRRRPGRGGREW